MKKKHLLNVLTAMIVTITYLNVAISMIFAEEYVAFKGSGTKEDPYQISTAYDLKLLSEIIAGDDIETAEKYANASYIQTADIDLKNSKFTPIGKYPGVGFYGEYNGNYHCISNMLISEERSYVGLFGRVAGGNILNLSVSGKVSTTSSIEHNTHIGGIVGELCDESTIRRCSFNGEISAADEIAGGVVGQLVRGGKIIECYSNAIVSSYAASGGIVGYVGDHNKEVTMTVDNCYFVGEVSNTSEAKTVGGIIGWLEMKQEKSNVVIANNYYLNTSCNAGVNGESYSGCDKLSSAMIKASAQILGDPFITNNETDDFNDGYPIFEWQSTPYQFKGSGTAEDPYQISNKVELEAMRDLINSQYWYKKYNNCYYIQTADIDLENEQWTDPIAKRFVDFNEAGLCFLGNYNGQGYSILNFNLSRSVKCAGLFGCVVNDAVIENLSVYGNVLSTKENVGGIVGEAQNSILIKNCSFFGNVTGTYDVGGIVGEIWNGGSVENCYGIVNVSGTKTGEGNLPLGGIVGRIDMGKLGSSYIKNCYHIGEISCSENVEKIYKGGVYGLINYMDGSEKLEIDNCYFSSEYCDVEGVNISQKDEYIINCFKINNKLMKFAADSLGEPFVTNPYSDFNEGYPIFKWQLDSLNKQNPYIIGDINNDSAQDVTDLTYISLYLLGDVEFDDLQKDAADVNADGCIDIADLAHYKQFVSKDNVVLGK
ncbi:MAG: hypothetical protein E7510_05965 [Ruminococcus sp.]|nr:hypothetical protein [Ruminococcus sp.]